MSGYTAEERYADEITRGLWLSPWKRREARREVLDHIADASDEKGVNEWNEETLKSEIGPPSKLRKLFVKNGLPWWAKGLKYFGYFILFLLFVAIGFNFYILWFYPLPPSFVAYVKANPEVLTPGGIDFTLDSDSVAWADPDDEEKLKWYRHLLDIREKANAIINAHNQTVHEKRMAFIETERDNAAAEGIYGATLDRVAREYNKEMMGGLGMPNMPEGQMGYGMGMMMPDMKTINENTWLLENADTPFVEPKMPEEELQKLLDLWAQVDDDSRLYFPEPTVSDEDIQLMKNVYDNFRAGRAQPPMHIPGQSQSDQQWLSIAFNLAMTRAANEGGELNLREIVEYAKQITILSETGFIMSLNSIPGNIARNLGDSRAPRFVYANARWADMLLDSFDPDPEPMITFMIQIAMTTQTFDALKDHVESLSELSAYQRGLAQLADIDYEKVYNGWPDYDEDRQKLNMSEMTSMFGTAITYSFFPPFQWQCSMMQWFHEPGTDSYLRYEILKTLRDTYMTAMMDDIFAPNAMNAEIRMKVADAQTNIAQTALDLSRWLGEGNPMDEWQPPQVPDPFHEDGIRAEQNADELTFRSAGPDQAYDSQIYHPSNGITSAGDISWTLSKDD